MQLESTSVEPCEEGLQLLASVICDCGQRLAVQMILPHGQTEVLVTGNRCVCGQSYSFLTRDETL